MESFGKALEVHSGPVTIDNNIIRLSYVPTIPTITLRAIVKSLSDLSNQFTFTVVHPPTLEERAQQIAVQERYRLCLRLILSVAVAIPTLIIGVIMMMVLPQSSKYRIWAMEPIWAGRVARGVWAMFIMSTFIYFFAADIFHRKALKELRSLYRPGVPFTRRLFRFGSMNLLVSEIFLDMCL